MTAPRVFLSYASEDRDIAESIARGLVGRGIDVWWDQWEIGVGHSIRRKIDEGLQGCTHFLVFLTPTALKKPWVNEEIDAGFLRKVEGNARFMPLIYGVSIGALPPLLRAMRVFEFRATETCLPDLANAINGVTGKPPIAPSSTPEAMPDTHLSPAATAIVRLFVDHSEHAFDDPLYTISELAERTDLSADDLEDALTELSGLVEVGLDHVLPNGELFAQFDRLWKPWDPAADGRRIAVDLINDPQFPTAAWDIAKHYDWPTRRLNAALAYLINRGIVGYSENATSFPWITPWVDKIGATRRFVQKCS